MNKRRILGKLIATGGAFCFGLAASAALASAELQIGVETNVEPAFIGDTIHYHCTVTNSGNATATNINGYLGPHNSDSAPNPSTDKYTSLYNTPSNPKKYVSTTST